MSFSIVVVGCSVQRALVALSVESSISGQDDRNQSRCADKSQQACSTAHGRREEKAERGAEE